MIHFYSQIPYSLGWFLLGFTSAFLYQILNRYSKLFGSRDSVDYYYHIIIITIIIYIYLIRTCLII